MAILLSSFLQIYPSLFRTLVLPASAFHPSLSSFPPFLVSSFICLLFHPFSLALSLCLILTPPQITPIHSPPFSRSLLFQCHIIISLLHFLASFQASQLLHFSYPSILISANLNRFVPLKKRSYHPGEMAPLRSPYDFDDEGNATSTSTTEPSSSGFRSSVTSRFTTTDASETLGDEDSSVPGA